jgi:hypothetical protein
MSFDPATGVAAPRTKPPVFRSVGQAYADVHAALSAMPDMLLVGLVASCVYAAIDIALGWSTPRPASPLPLLTVIGLIWNFAVTPIFIAVHRYLILGEHAARPVERGDCFPPLYQALAQRLRSPAPT